MSQVGAHQGALQHDHGEGKTAEQKAGAFRDRGVVLAPRRPRERGTPQLPRTAFPADEPCRHPSSLPEWPSDTRSPSATLSLQKRKSKAGPMAALTASAKNESRQHERQQGEEAFPDDVFVPAGFEDDRGGRNHPCCRGVHAGIGCDQEGDDAEQGGEEFQEHTLSRVPAMTAYQPRRKMAKRSTGNAFRNDGSQKIRIKKQQQRTFPGRLFRKQQSQGQIHEEKGAPNRNREPGCIDRSHGHAHRARRHAGEPLEDWTVGERNVAADPDAAARV